jgi:sortase A
VSLVTDSRTGLADWEIDSLFREDRRDLVGHLEGTALPGQPGNAVLTGHNYGYGYSGVFVHLGRLKVGDLVTVVTEAADTLVYKVASTERVPWRRRTLSELARHLEYLAPTGEERLTLVSCGGANVAPFPERVYVVAKPVDDR